MPLNVFADRSDDQLFLAVFLSDTQVNSVLWKIEEGEIEIIERSDSHNFSDVDSMLLKADTSLQELGKESEKTNKVLYCLDSSWTDASGITDEKKALLKKVSQELSLKAVGFVVNTEVIIDYLFKDKQVNNLLLANFSDSHLELTLVKDKKILAREKVGSSDDASADMNEALARLEQSSSTNLTYPARITAFSLQLKDSQLRSIQQKLIKVDWREEHNFLQRPIIDLIENKEAFKAVISHAGKALAVSRGIIKEEDQVKTAQAVAVEEPQVVSAVGFGFKQFGNVRNQKIETKSEKSNFSSFSNPPAGGSSSQVSMLAGLHVDNKRNGRQMSHMLSSLNSSQKKQMILGFSAGVITLFTLLLTYLIFFSTLIVQIEPDTKVISQDLEITLDPNTDNFDLDAKILPATASKKTVSGSQQTATTGIKIIGDKAVGKIEIVNKTENDTEFAAGTKLSAADKNFVLTNSVSVPAAKIEEQDDGEKKTYGKAEVDIEAEDFGAESNLSDGTEFTFANYDSADYEAKAISDLTGGSSREIQVVAKEDASKLKQELIAELSLEAEKLFQSESSGDLRYSLSGNYKIIDSEFNYEIGDEATTLSLDLEIEVEAYAYKTSDLKELSAEVLDSQVPSGYVLDGDVQVLSSPQETNDGSEVVLDANLSSNAMATFSEQELLNKISGLDLDQAAQVLNSDSLIDSVSWGYKPKFASIFIKKVPKSDKRVQFSIN